MQPPLLRTWNRQASLRRLRLPAWLLVAGILGVAAAAGQALGPVLVGGARADAGVVAGQAMRFMSADALVVSNPNLNQAVANIDTAGLVMAAAFRMHRGEDGILRFQVRNTSDGSQSAYLSLTRPQGSSADLNSTDPDVGLAHMEIRLLGEGRQMDVYLLTLTPEGYGDLDLDVRVGTADPLGSFNIALSLQEVP